MKGSVLPAPHMTASVNAWLGPLTPVALRLVSGNTYALLDALGREVDPPSDPPIYISGGVEDGVYLPQSAHSNLLPTATPTVSQLAYAAGMTLADAAMANPVLRIASGWEVGVVLSGEERRSAVASDLGVWYAPGLSVSHTSTAWGSEYTATGSGAYRAWPSVDAGTCTFKILVRDGAGEVSVAVLTGDWATIRAWASIDAVTGSVTGSAGTASASPAGPGYRWLTLTWESTTETNIVLITPSGGVAIALPSLCTAPTGRVYQSGEAPLVLTPDFALGTFAPDGSLPVTLAQPADSLSWDNAPTGCALVQTDATHYTLTQPAVADGNLIGYAALSWGSDDVAAFQKVAAATATEYSAALLVQVSGGSPTLDLLRPELRGDATGTITMTAHVIPGETGIYRCEFGGIQVASITSGYFGFRRGTDTRPCVTGPWQFGQGSGRFLPGNTSEADYTRTGSRVTLTRPCNETLEAEWS